MRALLLKLLRFRSDQRGNVLILFAFAVVPLFGIMGLAVDYSMANADRTAMQAALDNTALALSKNAQQTGVTPTVDDAWPIFQANFGASKRLLTFSKSDLTVTNSDRGKIDLQLNTIYNLQIASVLTNLIGMPATMAVDAHSQVQWGNSRLRVALVLDNTGSMEDAGKIGALKTATTNLLNTLKGVAISADDVYVSIVPFSKDVNVGSSNSSHDEWIDWTRWEAEPAIIQSSKPSNWSNVGPGSSCPFTNSNHGFLCTSGPANDPTCDPSDKNPNCASKIPQTGPYAGYICPSIDSGKKNSLMASIYYNGCYNSEPTTSTSTKTIATGSNASCGNTPNCSCSGTGSNKKCVQTTTTTGAPYTHTWISNPHSTWNGCVTDRGTSTAPGTTAGYDQKIDAPVAATPATLFSAEQYASCTQEIMGLNNNWTSMNTLVSNMTPNGNTNQPIGLVWGWQTLVGGISSLTVPPIDPNYSYNTVIILLSDGLNTQDRWYTSQTSIDNRMYFKSGSTVSGTCKNIKDSGITIYTVQVNTGGDPLSTLLQNCATDTSKFFMLTSASQIVTTFDQIGSALANLHLSQ